LEKSIGYAIITSQTNTINVENLPENIRNALTPATNQHELNHNYEERHPDKFMTLDETERQQIQIALELCNNNVIKAAALLGISKSALYAKIKTKDAPVRPSERGKQ
jgi:DNA-binding NtrC family response regulator